MHPALMLHSLGNIQTDFQVPGGTRDSEHEHTLCSGAHYLP